MDERLLVAYMAMKLLRPEQPAEVPAQKADEGIPEEGLLVAKAMPIMKAWTDDTGVTHIEGWISTPDRDLDKDSVEPEAFKGAIDGYFALGAPLTSDHHMKPDPAKGIMVRYPVGHLQQAALVRDGHIFKSANHPTDPADFEYFPENGTGVYARAVLTDELASSQVAKGNVRGFSWVGIVNTVDKLPGGRWKFLSVNPWRESTIAAFPVNTKATIVAAN